jgi:hypothetical protein
MPSRRQGAGELAVQRQQVRLRRLLERHLEPDEQGEEAKYGHNEHAASWHSEQPCVHVTSGHWTTPSLNSPLISSKRAL